jgi:hypothetical protein
LRFSFSDLGALEHELGDVGEESALAEVDLFEGDRGEELRENLIDVRGSFEVGRGRGKSGRKRFGFGGLLRESGVVGAERRMRAGKVHAATAVEGVEWVQREDSGNCDWSDIGASKPSMIAVIVCPVDMRWKSERVLAILG